MILFEWCPNISDLYHTILALEKKKYTKKQEGKQNMILTKNITSTLLDEVLLHIITIYFSPTENNGLVHLVFFDCPNGVFPF